MVLVLSAALASTAAGATTQEAASDDQAPALGVVQDLGPPAGEPLAGEPLEAATRELSSQLRCPVCQGLSVADSTSISALSMRDEIRDLLARGYTEEQIVAHFESSFGEFVRLVPKARGFNLLVWLLPVVGLLVGLVIVLRHTGREGREGSQAAPTEDDELSAYRARVLRELEGGGGPPE